MASKDYDWRYNKKESWPYERDAPWDEKWKKDRAELFSNTENELAPFNGWWWFVSNHVHKPIGKRVVRFPLKGRHRRKK
tara:strand:+ start:611 stop:847 length:237 start_codon:yes stop_codon:yes gene_type:complete